MILGIDEVGRGCWAGPLVIGAVVLGEAKIDGLTDSKALTAKKRLMLATEIEAKAQAIGLGWVSAEKIDEIGLAEALKLGCRLAVEQIKTPYHEIIIDGTSNFLAGTGKASYVTVLKKADLLIPAVSAASIVAKVARDQFMVEQAEQFPQYDFASNVGYGTLAHRQAIQKHGACELHRLSFKPLRPYAGKQKVKSGNKNIETTKAIGDLAETVVANELERRGHEIVARNWRTKWCEIDIVSLLDDQLFFTEVRYRKNAKFGDGLASITRKKQRQIRFSAEVFLAKNSQYSKLKPVLLVADISGQPAEIQQIVEII